MLFLRRLLATSSDVDPEPPAVLGFSAVGALDDTAGDLFDLD